MKISKWRNEISIMAAMAMAKEIISNNGVAACNINIKSIEISKINNGIMASK
jgi:hypothetical protein